jgi:hypothetical protein
MLIPPFTFLTLPARERRRRAGKTFMKYVVIIAVAILFYAGMLVALKKRSR